jgi:hypothetical protein
MGERLEAVTARTWLAIGRSDSERRVLHATSAGQVGGVVVGGAVQQHDALVGGESAQFNK